MDKNEKEAFDKELLSFIEESQIISRGPLSPKGSLVF